MNPKDIVYKMVVLGRRLTTHFILDIFWGSSFMFHVKGNVSRAPMPGPFLPHTYTPVTHEMLVPRSGGNSGTPW